MKLFLFFFFCGLAAVQSIAPEEVLAFCSLSLEIGCTENCSRVCSAGSSAVCGAICDTESSHIISLDFDGFGLTNIPESIIFFHDKLVDLSLNDNLLTELPVFFGYLVNLTTLHMENNPITSLPESFGMLENLRVLSFYKSKLESLPESFGSLQSLQIISLESNSLESMPDSFSSLSSLSILYLRGNQLSQLPSNFGELKNLTELYLDNNQLTSLPASFGSLISLSKLFLGYNKLFQLPDSFGSLSLTNLGLDGNCINCTEILKKNWPLIMKSSCANQRTDCTINTYSSSNPENENTNTGMSRSVKIYISCLAVLTVLVLVLVIWILSRYSRKPKFSPQKVLQMTELAQQREMNLPLISDQKHEIIIEPHELTFGCMSKLLPVDSESHETFVISTNKHKPIEFRLLLPVENSNRFKITTNLTEGKVKYGKEIEVDIGITLLCTTKLDGELLVVVAELGVIPVKIHVESQLSTKLDPKELEFGNVVGSGSFGAVYKGTWRGTEVAIKSYNESVICDEVLKSEIESEVTMCSALRTPFIVAYYGRAIAPGKYYIVMEFVKFGSLGAVLEKNKELDLKIKIRFAQDISAGMAFLHSNSIIHRDLKCDNVLIQSLDFTAPVCAKLSDFNTSRYAGFDAYVTRTKGVGTPIAQAPEVLSGDKYDFHADIYSFGMILWQLWTQMEPYSEMKNKFAIFTFVGQGHRLPIPESIPAFLSKLTQESWSQIPEQRPKFQEINKQLTDFLLTFNTGQPK